MAFFTGGFSSLSSLNFNRISGLAWDSTKFYVTESAVDALYTLSLTPRITLTRIGTSTRFGVNETNPQGLAWDGTNLYMLGDSTNALYTVDTTTGEATRVGSVTNFNVGEDLPRGLAWDGTNLYMVGTRTDALYTLNRTTGEATRVGTARFFGSVREADPQGLTWDGNDLYMTGSQRDFLYTVDRTTGEATRVGSVFEFGVQERSPGALGWDGKDLYMVGAARGGFSQNTLYRALKHFAVLELPVSATFDNPVRTETLDLNIEFSENITGLTLSDLSTTNNIPLSNLRGSGSSYTVTLTFPKGVATNTRVTLAARSVSTTETPSTTGPTRAILSDLIYADVNVKKYFTGSFTVISTNGFGVRETGPGGLTWDGENLYMVGYRTDSLYTIDRDTGQATLIGTVPEDIPSGLAWNGQNLYIVGTQNKTLDITDRTSGGITTRGRRTDFGLRLGSSNPQGLAWDGRNLYLLSNNALYTLDLRTGEATFVGGLGVGGAGTAPQGLAWDGRNLYAVDNDSDALYIVNRDTGGASRVGDVSRFGANVRDPEGLAWDGENLYMVTAGNGGFYRADAGAFVTIIEPVGIQLENFTIPVEFAVPVSDLEASDFSVSEATISSINNVSATRTEVNISLPSDSSGNIVLTLNANSVNIPSESETGPDQDVISDPIPYITSEIEPTLTPSIASSQNNRVENETITLDITFNAAVENLTLSDLSATNNVTLSELTGEGSSYTVKVTFPLAVISSTVITLAANSVNILDTTKAGPIVDTSSPTIYFDTNIKATFTPSVSSSENNRVHTETITLDIAFNTDIEGLELSDLASTNNVILSDLEGENSSYTVTVNLPINVSSNTVITLNANSVNILGDSDSIGPLAAISSDPIYFFFVPSVTATFTPSIQSTENNRIPFPDITLDLIFSREIEGLTLSDLSATNGVTLSNLTGSDKSYTVTLTFPENIESSTVITLSANSVNIKGFPTLTTPSNDISSDIIYFNYDPSSILAIITPSVETSPTNRLSSRTFPLNIRFNTEVEGLKETDFSATSEVRLSHLVGSGDSYTLTVDIHPGLRSKTLITLRSNSVNKVGDTSITGPVTSAHSPLIHFSTSNLGVTQRRTTGLSRQFNIELPPNRTLHPRFIGGAMAWDGTTLHLNISNDAIVIMNTDTATATHVHFFDEGFTIRGLAFDGTNLLIIRNEDNSLYSVHPDTTDTTKIIELPSSLSIVDIAWDGINLYGITNEAIYLIDQNTGNTTLYFTLRTEGIPFNGETVRAFTCTGADFYYTQGGGPNTLSSGILHKVDRSTLTSEVSYYQDTERRSVQREVTKGVGILGIAADSNHLYTVERRIHADFRLEGPPRTFSNITFSANNPRFSSFNIHPITGTGITFTTSEEVKEDVFTVRVTPSRPIEEVDITDFFLNKGVISSINIIDNNNIDLTVIPPENDEGNIVIAVPADQFKVASNIVRFPHVRIASRAISYDTRILVDITPSIISSEDNRIRTQTTTVDIVFNKDVEGLTLSDLSATNGVTLSNVTGSNKAYTVTLTFPNNVISSTVVTLNADSVNRLRKTNILGPPNNIESDTIYFDTVLSATITPTITSSVDDRIEADSIIENINFNRDVEGLTLSDLSATNGSTLSDLTGSGDSYTVRVNFVKNVVLTTIITLRANSVNAVSDPTIIGPAQNTFSHPIFFDNEIRPVLTPAIIDQTITTLTTTLDISFNTNIEGLSLSDLSATNNVTLSDLTGSGDSYTVTLTFPQDIATQTVVTLAANSVNIVGEINNTGPKTDISSPVMNFFVDTGAIIVNFTPSEESEANNRITAETITLDLTFNRNIIDLTLSDLSATNNATLSNLIGSDNAYTVTLTFPQNIVSETVITLTANSVRGMRNNNFIGPANDADSDSIYFDSRIIATLTTPVSSQQIPLSRPSLELPITFNRDIEGLTLSDFSTTNNATLSNLNGSKDTYTVLVTFPENIVSSTVITLNNNSVNLQGDTSITGPINNVSTDTIYFNTLPLIATLTPSIASSLTNKIAGRANITLNINFNKNILGLRLSSFVVPSDATLSNLQGSGSSYTVTLIFPNDVDSDTIVILSANSVNLEDSPDIRGPLNPVRSVPIYFTTQNVIPTFTLPEGNSVDNPVYSSQINISLRFNKEIQGLSISDLSATNNVRLVGVPSGGQNLLVTLAFPDNIISSTVITIAENTVNERGVPLNIGPLTDVSSDTLYFNRTAQVNGIPVTAVITASVENSSTRPIISQNTDINIVFNAVVTNLELSDLSATNGVTLSNLRLRARDHDAQVDRYTVTADLTTATAPNTIITLAAHSVNQFTDRNLTAPQTEVSSDTIYFSIGILPDLVPSVDSSPDNHIFDDTTTVNLTFDKNIESLSTSDLLATNGVIVSNITGSNKSYTITLTFPEDVSSETIVTLLPNSVNVVGDINNIGPDLPVSSPVIYFTTTILVQFFFRTNYTGTALDIAIYFDFPVVDFTLSDFNLPMTAGTLLGGGNSYILRYNIPLFITETVNLTLPRYSVLKTGTDILGPLEPANISFTYDNTPSSFLFLFTDVGTRRTRIRVQLPAPASFPGASRGGRFQGTVATFRAGTVVRLTVIDFIKVDLPRGNTFPLDYPENTNSVFLVETWGTVIPTNLLKYNPPGRKGIITGTLGVTYFERATLAVAPNYFNFPLGSIAAPYVINYALIELPRHQRSSYDFSAFVRIRNAIENVNRSFDSTIRTEISLIAEDEEAVLTGEMALVEIRFITFGGVIENFGTDNITVSHGTITELIEDDNIYFAVIQLPENSKGELTLRTSGEISIAQTFETLRAESNIIKFDTTSNRPPEIHAAILYIGNQNGRYFKASNIINESPYNATLLFNTRVQGVNLSHLELIDTIRVPRQLGGREFPRELYITASEPDADPRDTITFSNLTGSGYKYNFNINFPPGKAGQFTIKYTGRVTEAGTSNSQEVSITVPRSGFSWWFDNRKDKLIYPFRSSSLYMFGAIKGPQWAGATRRFNLKISFTTPVTSFWPWSIYAIPFLGENIQGNPDTGPDITHLLRIYDIQGNRERDIFTATVDVPAGIRGVVAFRLRSFAAQVYGAPGNWGPLDGASTRIVAINSQYAPFDVVTVIFEPVFDNVTTSAVRVRLHFTQHIETSSFTISDISTTGNAGLRDLEGEDQEYSVTVVFPDNEKGETVLSIAENVVDVFNYLQDPNWDVKAPNFPCTSQVIHYDTTINPEKDIEVVIEPDTTFLIRDKTNVRLNINFNVEVFGLSLLDLSASYGSVPEHIAHLSQSYSPPTLSNLQGSGANYTADLHFFPTLNAPGEEGYTVITLAANSVTQIDHATNHGPSENVSSNRIHYNTISDRVAISASITPRVSSSSNNRLGASELEIEVTFNTPVVNITLSDFTTSGGTLSNFTPETTAAANDHFTLKLTLPSNSRGSIIITLTANSVNQATFLTNQGPKENINSAPIYYDTRISLPPDPDPVPIIITASLSLENLIGDLGQNIDNPIIDSTATLGIQFSHNIEGLTLSDLSATNGVTLSNLTGSGSFYTATIGFPINTESDTVITLNMNSVNRVGSSSTIGPNTDVKSSLIFFRTIEVRPIAVSMAVTTPGLVTPDGMLTAAPDNRITEKEITIGISFNTSVQGLSESDFTLENATIADLTGTGDEYVITMAFTPNFKGVASITLSEDSVFIIDPTNTQVFGPKTSATISDLYFNTFTPITAEIIPDLSSTTTNPIITDTLSANITFNVNVNGLELSDLSATNDVVLRDLEGHGKEYSVIIAFPIDTELSSTVITLEKMSVTEDGVAVNMGPTEDTDSEQINFRTRITPITTTLTPLTSSTLEDPIFTSSTLIRVDFNISVLDLDKSDFSATNNVEISTLRGSDNSYLLTITFPKNTIGSTVITLRTAAVTDPFRSTNVAPEEDLSTDTIYFNSTPQPLENTVDIYVSPTGVVSGDYTIMFVWNESITGFTTDDISLSAGTKGVFRGSEAVYFLGASIPQTGKGSIAITVAANSVGGNPETTKIINYNNDPNVIPLTPISSSIREALKVTTDSIVTAVDTATTASAGTISFHNKLTGTQTDAIVIPLLSDGRFDHIQGLDILDNIMYLSDGETTQNVPGRIRRFNFDGSRPANIPAFIQLSPRYRGIKSLTHNSHRMFFSAAEDGNRGRDNRIRSLNLNTFVEDTFNEIVAFVDSQQNPIDSIEISAMAASENRLYIATTNDSIITGSNLRRGIFVFNIDEDAGENFGEDVRIIYYPDIHQDFTDSTIITGMDFNAGSLYMVSSDINIRNNVYRYPIIGQNPPLWQSIPHQIINRGESLNLNVFVSNANEITFNLNFDRPEWLSIEEGILKTDNILLDNVTLPLTITVSVIAINDHGHDSTPFRLTVNPTPLVLPVWRDIPLIILQEGDAFDLSDIVENATDITFKDTFTPPAYLTINNGILQISRNAVNRDTDLELPLTAIGPDGNTDHTQKILIKNTLSDLKEISYLGFDRIWRVYINGIDVSHNFLMMENINYRLDVTLVDDFVVGDCSFVLKDVEGYYDSDNPNNFFVENNLPVSGNGVPIIVEVGYNVENTIISTRIFVGIILQTAHKTISKTTRILCTDHSYPLRHNKITDFGIQKENILLSEKSETYEGIYEIPETLTPISERSLEGQSNNKDLNILPSIQTDGESLDPFNTKVSDDTLKTEGGLLEHDPIVNFKAPIRNKSIRSILNALLDEFSIYNTDIELDENILKTDSDFNSTRGRIGYDIEKDTPNRYPKDWIVDENNRKFYILYGSQYNNISEMLLEYNADNDKWTLLFESSKDLEFWQLTSSDYDNFYIVGTRSYERGTLPQASYDSGEITDQISSNVSIFKFSRTRNLLTTFVEPTNMYPPTLANMYFVGSGRAIFTEVRTSVLPDTRAGFDIVNNELYYRYATPSQFGVAKATLIGETSAVITQNVDRYYNRTAFAFTIDSNSLYMGYTQGTESDSNLKIDRRSLSSSTITNIVDINNPRSNGDFAEIEAKDVTVGSFYSGCFELAVHNNDIYFVVQTQRKLPVEATINRRTNNLNAGAILYKANINTKNTTIIKGYKYSQLAARSLTVHNDKMYFFEGSHYLYYAKPYEENEDVTYQDQVGYLNSVAANGTLEDPTIVWHSRLSNENKYDGIHGGMASPMLSENENLHMICGYGNWNDIDDYTSEITRKDNLQWIVRNDTIERRISELDTNNRTPFDVIRQTAILTNSIIGFEDQVFFIRPRQPNTSELVTAITSVETSFNFINNRRDLPNEGIILIDKELMYYTNISDNNFTTVVRGYNNTMNVPHAAGAKITFISHILEGNSNYVLDLFKRSDDEHLFNRVFVNYDGDVYPAIDENSEISYEKDYTLSTPLTRHDDRWAKVLGDEILSRTKDLKNLITIVLKPSYYIRLGDICLIRQEEGSSLFAAAQVHSIDIRENETEIILKTL